MSEILSGLATQLKSRVLSLVYEEEFGFEKNGKSADLGGEEDRKLLLFLRDWADQLVTTAKTAEAEEYKQPSRPLILLTRREDAANWLNATRLRFEDNQLVEILKSKKTVFETGMTASRELFEQGLIDQVLIHHDSEQFKSQLLRMDVDLGARISYHQRYISLFERRGN